MQHFLIYEHRYEETVSRIAACVRGHREEILEGLESASEAIARVCRGENHGKRLIRVDCATVGT